MEIPLSVRELEPEDLPRLEWTGGPEHLRAIADDLPAAATGHIDQLVVALTNGCLIGFGAVDYRKGHDAGRLWMLSVHETWQSLGVGTLLIRALEERIVARGKASAVIAVEHDNPRARDLYQRLGYLECGSELDSWLIDRRRSYVTVCTVLRRQLR